MAAAAITSARVPDGISTPVGSNSAPGSGPALSAIPGAIAGLEPSPAAALAAAAAPNVALPGKENPRTALELLGKMLSEEQMLSFLKAGANGVLPERIPQMIVEFDRAGLDRCVNAMLSSSLFTPHPIHNIPLRAYYIAGRTNNLPFYQFMVKRFPEHSLEAAAAAFAMAYMHDHCDMARAIGDTPGLADHAAGHRTAIEWALALRLPKLVSVLLSLKTFKLTMEQLTEMAGKVGWISFAKDLTERATREGGGVHSEDLLSYEQFPPVPGQTIPTSAFAIAGRTNNLPFYRSMVGRFPTHELEAAAPTFMVACVCDNLDMARAIGDTPGLADHVRGHQHATDWALDLCLPKLIRTLLSLKTFKLTMEQLTKMARELGWISFAEDLACTPTVDDKKE